MSVVPFGTAIPAAYYLVDLANGARPDDLPLSDATSAWSMSVRLKSVGVSFEQALTNLDAARTLLVPRGRAAPLVVTGRGVTLVFERHEADYIDRDVTPHKAISLDTYTLSSVPA